MKDFLSFIYPQLCVSCQREIRKTEDLICLHCFENFSPFQLIDDINPVEQLFWGKCEVEYATACFNFIKGEKLQELIHQFKYKGNKAVAQQLAIQMAKKLQSSSKFNSIDVICPVPSTNKKLKKRSYNQAEELAKIIAKQAAIPFESLLIKKEEKGSQTAKNVHDRHVELEQSFRLKSTTVGYQHVLLIDDVITSGATLSACAKILQNNSRCKISILALAYRNIR